MDIQNEEGLKYLSTISDNSVITNVENYDYDEFINSIKIKELTDDEIPF